MIPPLCSRCKAEITWCATVNGKMQPIDRQPNPAGNLRLVDEYVQTQRGILQRVLVAKPGELSLDDDGVRYMPHHATCPDVEDFRKPKGPARQRGTTTDRR